MPAGFCPRIACCRLRRMPMMASMARTGKSLVYRIIADCAARENQIFDEWLIRDQGAIVRQMGWEPKAFAADLIAREGGPEACVKPFTPASDIAGGYTGTGNDHPVGQRYAEILTRIMGADMAAIRSQYDRAPRIWNCRGASQAMAGRRPTGSGWVCAPRCRMPPSPSTTPSAARMR